MPDNILLFTNVTNIILIVLFLVYRYRVKINEERMEEMRNVLRELIIQTCNITCICARLDYQTGKIPKDVVIDVIMSQPIHDSLKIEHLKFSDVTYEEIKEKTNEVIRSYFKQMGKEKINQTTDG